MAVVERLRAYFEFSAHQTDFRRETLAGVTTFMTMAYIIVGLLMVEPIARIDFKDYTELIPAFAVIVLMSFTYNIGIGITAGFVLYPFAKLVAGRRRQDETARGKPLPYPSGGGFIAVWVGEGLVGAQRRSRAQPRDALPLLLPGGDTSASLSASKPLPYPSGGAFIVACVGEGLVGAQRRS